MFFSFKISNAQIANYVANGGFEDLIDCNNPFYFKIKSWGNIDTTKPGFQARNVCYGNVPSSGNTYQNPRNGNGFILGTMLCDVNFCNPNINRNYFKNRLKAKLNAGSVYCVKFYVNNINLSAYGIDSYGAYFSDNSIDTINYTMRPLTYITPQIQNPIGNIIVDTLNWIPITGTFVANGAEKYMVIGNFKSDATTMKTQIQPTVSYAWCDVNIDDVSCIDLNLPADAGLDTYCIPGNTVYIGRLQDVGIDEACMWYKLPNMATAIDTAAGIFVSPVVTTTYVVKQDICDMIKWDTVIVYASGVGLNELKIINEKLKIYPNPTDGILNLDLKKFTSTENYTVKIINLLGQRVLECKMEKTLNISSLQNGIYFLQLFDKENLIATEKIIKE